MLNIELPLFHNFQEMVEIKPEDVNGRSIVEVSRCPLVDRILYGCL